MYLLSFPEINVKLFGKQSLGEAVAIFIIFECDFGVTNEFVRSFISYSKDTVLPGRVTLYLWPLHTRAKSRDHEIVSAQKKVVKSRLKAPPKPCMCGHGPSSVV